MIMRSLRLYYCATRWRLSHGEGRFRSIRIHVVGECERNGKARVKNEAEARKKERMNGQRERKQKFREHIDESAKTNEREGERGLLSSIFLLLS